MTLIVCILSMSLVADDRSALEDRIIEVCGDFDARIVTAPPTVAKTVAFPQMQTMEAILQERIKGEQLGALLQQTASDLGEPKRLLLFECGIGLLAKQGRWDDLATVLAVACPLTVAIRTETEFFLELKGERDGSAMKCIITAFGRAKNEVNRRNLAIVIRRAFNWSSEAMPDEELVAKAHRFLEENKVRINFKYDKNAQYIGNTRRSFEMLFIRE